MPRLSRPTPALIVGLLALFLALGGTGYAATSVVQAPSAAKKKKSVRAKAGPRGKTGKTGPAGKPGPAGPQGAPGPAGSPGAAGAIGPAGAAGKAGSTGATGPTGADGSPGGFAFAGRMQNLNTSDASNAFFAISGISANSAEAPVQMLSPGVPTLVSNLRVVLTAAPGGSAIRTFSVRVNGNDIGSSCAILSSQTDCGVGGATVIPANSKIAIRSSVASGAASSAEALFSLVLEDQS